MQKESEMEKNDHRDIWVFLEEFEGKPKQVGAELLGQARRLADEIGQEVAAVIIAHDADEALEMARRYGADRAYVIEGECYRHHRGPVCRSILLSVREVPARDHPRRRNSERTRARIACGGEARGGIDRRLHSSLHRS